MLESVPIPGQVISHRDRYDSIAELDRLRAVDPVARIELPALEIAGKIEKSKKVPAWLVTRYADVRKVLGDPGLFSSTPRLAAPNRMAVAARKPTSLLACDPPDHDRLRRIIAPEFTRNRIRRIQSRVDEIVKDSLDGMERSGPPADLVKEFAEPISLWVMCEVMGISRDDGIQFQRIRREANAAVIGDREKIVTLPKAHEPWNGISDALARQRREPDDSLGGVIMRRHGDEITDVELTDIFSAMLIPGYHNTVSMLSLGVLLLLEHPDQLSMLVNNQDLGDRALEEMLRYLSVISGAQGRTATSDVTIGDHEIRSGDLVICSLASANRDEALGAEMGKFDLSRQPAPHVAFGYGIHHCLGAHLTTLVMRSAYLALFQRFPALRVASRFEDLLFWPMPAYSVSSLPVTW